MKATQRLHNLGQRLWLDNITRELIDNDTLSRYIGELAITGVVHPGGAQGLCADAGSITSKKGRP
jgi:hypothetical protein